MVKHESSRWPAETSQHLSDNARIGLTSNMVVHRLIIVLSLAYLVQISHAVHHMKQPPIHTVNRRDSDLPLRVTNQCQDDLWPAILTDAGNGPGTSGFHLAGGASQSFSVSADWKGRVWARTNCSTNGIGGAMCTTGDCGQLQCQGAGQPPATLAEFTYAGANNQAFYDLSLVDGYNIPMGIISLLSESNNPNLTDIPPNMMNPICVASAGLIGAVSDTSDQSFGSNASYPIPLEQTVTPSFVEGWCPFPLLLLPPQRPGNGIYPYPDDNIQRPLFSPCLSACAKWSADRYCCTGSYDSPSSCQPSYYSTQAKKVCPDAYSYAFDDQTSTFIIPQGGGFEVVLCPAGRSSNILAVFGDQQKQVAQSGYVTRSIEQLAQNRTYIAEKNEGVSRVGDVASSVAAFLVLAVWSCF